MLPSPKVPCRLLQEEDPAPSFPHEPVPGGVESLGSRLEGSIQRLEKRIDQLVDVLEAQQPGLLTVSSAWAEDVPGDQQEARRQDQQWAQWAQDDTSEASTHQLHTISEEEPGTSQSTAKGTEHETAVDAVHSDAPSNKQSEAAQNARKRFRFSSPTMRSPSGIEAHYQRSASLMRRRSGGPIAQFVMSTYFDTAMSILVIINAVMLGVQIDAEVKNKSKHPMFKYFEWMCTAVFTLELILRLWAVGLRRMCMKTERLMTMLDFILVVTSNFETLVDILVSTGSGGASTAFMVRLLKVLRIGRLLRPLRTVALLGELRVIGAMIASSFRPLFWLTCIVCCLTYCFALVLTQGAAHYLRDALSAGSLPEEYAEVQKEYGSVGHTMYALFLAMTGGRDWGEIAGIISNAGYVYSAVVICFVFINLFSVLNIVTGIFVDGAIELAKRDRAMMIEKNTIHREANRAHLASLLSQVDADGDGVISKDEFFGALQESGVQEFMDALGIDPDNAAEVFLLLDSDSDGHIDVVEFIAGMEKIRGEARSVDIQMLLLYTRKIIDVLNGMQGIQSHMLARIPVPPKTTPKRTPNRWDEPQTPPVLSTSGLVPGLPG